MHISRHATEQMIRRRIAHRDVELTIGYGQERHCAGATIYVLRFRDIPPPLVANPHARRAEGTTVVVANDVVQTVYRNRDLRRLRHKPRHGHAVAWRQAA